jgi:signal transduction histidine kinase
MSTLVVSRVNPAHFPRWLDRLWRVAGSVNVRTKILGIVLGLTVLLGLGVTLQVRSVMVDVFMGELESRGLSVASDLAARSAEPILLNDTFALHQLLSETVKNHPDALYAFVVDGQGQVMAHTFGTHGFPTALLDQELTALAVMQDGSQVRHLYYKSNEGPVHEFSALIFPEGAETVRLGLTENRLLRITNAVTSQMLFTTLLVAFAGIGAAMLLTWLLTRPILDLVAATREVGHGNLAARAPHWADDEIGALADAFNVMVSDLAESQQAIADKEQARTQLLQKLITAQEEERRRIARELHDGIGQVLTSLMVGNKLASQLKDLADVHAKNEELYEVSMEALGQVRMLSRQLRPSIMDDLGLAAALERYASDFSSLYSGMNVEVHCELPVRLPDTVEITLYRIIQEAMTNAARHSRGTTVGVLVTQRDGHVQAIIEDDGIGFDPLAARKASRSVGLHAMVERAELIGGELNIESSEHGTTVYVEIPV